MSETVTVTVKGLGLEFTHTGSSEDHVLVRVVKYQDTMMTPEELRVLSASIGMIAKNLGA